ncbi:UPF0481 protein At3g47200-like [Prosopis cineraria]|uniref:UPF0481 protein At3g47200-like n=1 Tax=Prosopis cineraria TaxID=364024 RepID=UPI0024104016|nr:UPF0481 protein At3g47200-like [Prosopis cineraria]
MADMTGKELISENSEEIVEMQPLLSTPNSTGLSSNHSEQHMEDKVMVDIKQIIEESKDGCLPPTCCIYRVPPTIRHLNEEAYTPKLISIGPFHYGHKRLQEMEAHKKIFFKAFTQRAKSRLDDLVRFVKHSEPKVRASYSENIKLNEEELVKLILVDGGFIIELFMRYHNFDQEIPNDAKLSQPWLASTIKDDLVLLENQLPYFVIEELFNIAFPADHHDDLPSFLDLSYKYFKYFNIQYLRPNTDVCIKHFTDLLRLFYLPTKLPMRNLFTEVISNYVLLYGANELQEAGVKLKASTSKCSLDLKFSGHTLEISQILVEDRTEMLFRNMIALEQCHYHSQSYIIDYVVLMDWLINTHKDVDVLVHKEIMATSVGDANNVVTLVNGLGINVLHLGFNSEYTDICRRLNGFCEHWWHKKKVTLRRDYCRTPWQFVVSIAGIILVILSVVQTLFSILQVVK